MSTLYVLQLENGKYYVGKTQDIDKRYREHKNGQGSEWTKIYKPVKILETRNISSDHDENNTTKDYMKKYGIANVRGGAYCQVDLTEEQENSIRHEIRSNTDNCYKCGKPGHFANKCSKKSSFTATCGCGKSFMIFEEFMSHIQLCIQRNSVAKEQVWACGSCNKEFTNLIRAVTHERKCSEKQYKEPTCYRCGRKGHYSTTCYARTHISGNDLDDEDSSGYHSE
jgi:predicted GIY-YIG superfamily endonuclease